MKIPFVSLVDTNKKIKEEILLSFEKCFDDGNYILGRNLQKFEKEYSIFSGVKYTLGVSNGFDALHVALRSLGISQGDEVIVPSNTFIATVLAISAVGATPVFVEPDIKSYTIDCLKIRAALTLKTKCIIPVHLYGQPCDMTTIMDIAKSHSLFVIEDNAQAQGATHNKLLTGSFGNVNATSFYPGKNLGALGDAGAITTNDSSLAKRIKMLRNYGSEIKYHHEVLGFNMRLDDCQASILSVKLKYLNEWNSKRTHIAFLYQEYLKGIPEIILPCILPKSSHVFHLYVIRTPERDALQQYLSNNGVETLIHYPIPPHLQNAYKNLGYRKGDFPVAEELSNTLLSLPIWPGMTDDQVLYISDLIRSYFK